MPKYFPGMFSLTYSDFLGSYDAQTGMRFFYSSDRVFSIKSGYERFIRFQDLISSQKMSSIISEFHLTRFVANHFIFHFGFLQMHLEK